MLVSGNTHYFWPFMRPEHDFFQFLAGSFHGIKKVPFFQFRFSGLVIPSWKLGDIFRH
jgi:hypothetical protein